MTHNAPQPDFPGLPAELRERVTSHWQGYRGDRGLEAGPVLDSLPRVWACSDYVAQTCVLHPALLEELVASGDLERAYGRGELAERIAALAQGIDSEAALHRALRQLRRREAIRVAWRNLAGWDDLDAVMATLSELADACIDLALTKLHEFACSERGTPLDEHGAPLRLSVLALGKLGGHELNFSSDIDLIFAYRAEGRTDAERPLTNHEFFRKLAARLIKALDQITEDGYVFRVDMRLRPNGNSGPLVLSFDAIVHYYQVHGRDWERYALIKARAVAGDRAAGDWLLAQLRPFIYRKYLDFGAIQAIRDMKQMIDREVRRKHGEGDIKLGRGGIREIEFIVQSLQLIRGGREPRLQGNRIQPVLAQLARCGALDASSVAVLESCYQFLRDLEHRLQMLADEQTHLLPRSDRDRRRVALAMNQADWPALERLVEKVKDRVHANFQLILSEKPPAGDTVETLADLWSARIERDAAVPLLAQAGYQAPESTLELIQQFRQGKSYHVHSKLGRERLDRLMPAVINLAADTEQPDETLKRLARFIEAVGRRSAYLILLIENPQALRQLVNLCGASAWVSNWLGKYPLLLEELLGPIADSPESFERQLEDEITQRLQPLGPLDIEAHMEAFRELHHAQILRIAAVDIAGSIDRAEVAARLCTVAEKLLDAVAMYCRGELSVSLGHPAPENPEQPAAFGIVGYGKLGGRELGYNSDIDLVYMHHGCKPGDPTSGGRRVVSNEQYFARLAQRITHVIATRTPSGVLYEIDNRLRPSGGAGPLVTSLTAFASYQVERAWTWEHQALVRARMVSGPAPLVAGFERIRRDVIRAPRDADKLRSDVRDMRGKMRAANDRGGAERFDLKHGEGGIIDIEFIVQYYVLRHAHEHPDLAGPRGTLELLAAVEAHGLMGQEVANGLKRAYQRYLDSDHGSKLAEREPLLDAGLMRDERRHVSAIWNRVFKQPGHR